MGVFKKLFGKSNKNEISQTNNNDKYYIKEINNIKYNVTPHEAVLPNENEKKFIKELIKQLIEEKLYPNCQLSLTRLSDKTLNVDCKYCFIGKIKLSGKKTYMQILSGLYDIDVLRDLSIDEYISKIPLWIKYIKYCKRN